MLLRLSQLIELWGVPNHAHAFALDLQQPIGPICTDSRQLVKGRDRKSTRLNSSH